LSASYSSKTQKTISLGGTTYLKDMNITIDQQNMVRIVGFYGESAKDDVAKGVFTISFDEDMNISKKSQKAFSLEFVKSFTKVKKRETEGELANFDIKQIVNNNDGSVVVLAELSYVQIITTRDARRNISRRYIYYDNDIIWIKLTKGFEIGQIKQIAKSQVAVRGSYILS
jgi:hypothetical protein